MKHIIALFIAAALLAGSTPTVAAPSHAPASVQADVQAGPVASCWRGVPFVYRPGQARCWRGVPFVLPSAQAVQR